METAVCVSGFLLLVFSTGAQLSPDPEFLFGVVGDQADFGPETGYGPEIKLFKMSTGKEQLLVDCSQLFKLKQDGYDVRCHLDRPKTRGVLRSAPRPHSLLPIFYYITMHKLTMSQSGDYRLELQRKTEKPSKSIHLTVCAEGHEEPFVETAIGGRVLLCEMNSALGNTSLRLFRTNWRYQPKTTLVLDTNSSLEPLTDDLRSRLQVDLNTLQVTLTWVVEGDSEFYCTTWREDQCQNVNYIRLYQSSDPEDLFANEEEDMSLPCIIKGESPGRVYWTTLSGYGQLIINETHQQEVMYMLNGSQTGDYSLIIPSLSLQHSGEYVCFGDGWRGRIQNIRLFVCTNFSPLVELFSDGESVCLSDDSSYSIMSMHREKLYRQKFQEPKILFLDSRRGYSPLLEDFKGRMPMTADCFLSLSNLTAEDSGLYTRRVFGKDNSSNCVCFEENIHLVYRDPFGVYSPFYRAYAPLLGCGLLGLVAAVIWFKLRSRRGEQTSGHQSGEGQQSGDDDLYEEVEMAEHSV